MIDCRQIKPGRPFLRAFLSANNRFFTSGGFTNDLTAIGRLPIIGKFVLAGFFRGQPSLAKQPQHNIFNGGRAAGPGLRNSAVVFE